MIGAANSGAWRHFRALEGLYASAPVNALFHSRLEIVGEGNARIAFEVAHLLPFGKAGQDHAA